MKFLHPRFPNRPIAKSIVKYKIDWDGKSLSKYQFKVKQFLKKYWQGKIVLEEFTIPKTRMSIDIFNISDKICLEVQGEQHNKYSKFFHGRKSKLFAQMKRDIFKMEWAELNGFEYWEIFPEDIPNLSKDFFKEKFDFTL